MPAPLSQRQLAARLHLSPMTVSRALRGADGVSEAVRARILAAARTHGLAAPATPRLREPDGRLHVLCTMAPDPHDAGDSPFHQRLLAGLRRGALECASQIVNCAEVRTEWPHLLARRQVDGAVMVWGDEHDAKPSTPCPVPAVYVFYGPATADVVTVDNFGGAYALGQALAAAGHRRVAFAGPDSRVALERLAGLSAGLATGGGGVPPGLARLERGGGGRAVSLADHLLAVAARGRQRRPGQLGFTAIMAYNDFIACRLIARFAELGLRVPADVSVVGFDGVVPPDYTGPRLTTCAIPLEELGAEAARLVYWRLDHPTAVRRVLALEAPFTPGASVLPR